MKSEVFTTAQLAPLSEKHFEGVRRIYLQGIASGHATFETECPPWKEWDKKHLEHSRFVASQGETVTGWAALSPVSDRCVYGGVAEVSVYVDSKFAGQGIGYALLTALVESSEERGIWTVQAGVFPENAASVRLHEKCGFKRIGIREKLGKMNGVWRDVLLMERRSPKIN